nr:hypothetical protein [Granulosicoccus sp.]
MRQGNPKGNMSGSTVLYVLLALAVIGLIVCWTLIKSRDASIVDANTKIAELEQTNDSANAKIASLTQQLSTSEQNNADLTAVHLETKRQLSFSRAANQRSEAVANARTNLMNQASTLRSQVADLSVEADKVAPLKKTLSFANASNSRLQHVAVARDNLITEVKESKAMNAALSEEAAKIPGLKSKLSYANAANARLEHVSEARGNLMIQNQLLQTEADKVPGLEENLKAATTENTRLRVIEDATKTFIESIGDSVKPSANQSSAVTSENSELLGVMPSQDSADASAATAASDEMLAAAEKKRSLAAAEAQRAQQRLKIIPKLTASLATLEAENESLKTENAVIPELKKELSLARAQVQRHAHVAQARKNLMAQLQETNTKVAMLEGTGSYDIQSV